MHRDDRTGRVIVFSAIDNLWKGAASQAVQNLNLMFGRPEGEGISELLRQPLGARPDHVTELGGGGLPAGFRAAGVAAGIKASPARPDWGAWSATRPRPRAPRDSPPPGTQAAPVLLCRERCAAGCAARRRGQLRQRQRRHRPPGLRERGQDAGRRGARRRRQGGSGGGLLHRRDRRAAADAQVTQGIAAAAHALAADGDAAFSAAIQTTDAFEKRARLQVTLPSGTVTLTGQAKGAGMISPGLRHPAGASSSPTPRCRRRPATCCWASA